MRTAACSLWTLLALQLLWPASLCAQLAPQPANSPASPAVTVLREPDLRDALDLLAAATDTRPDGWTDTNSGIAAAAGNLHRRLAQLSDAERFDLWHAWTMPSAGRAGVRVLTTPVPRTAPPKEFARALGERPRNDAFPIASVRAVRAFFCSGWELARAAEAVGRLGPLVVELETLSQQGTPGAESLLTLVQLADRRIDAAQMSEALTQRAAKLSERDAADPNGAIDPVELAIAAAALQHEELQTPAGQLLAALSDHIPNSGAPRWKALVRVAQAAAVMPSAAAVADATHWRQPLQHWIPSTGGSAADHAAGGPESIWLTQEDHLLHLAGTAGDVLFFRYPLTGEFEFHCEAQEGGEIGTDGGLVYGGISCDPAGGVQRVWTRDADFQHPFEKPCYFLRHEAKQPVFNRYTVRSRPESVQFLTNLHGVWFDDDAAAGSPWLGLLSRGENRPLFRNLRLTGSPVIPREVKLSQGDELRGWQAAFLGETQRPFTPHPQPAVEGLPAAVAAPDNADWQMQAGVISAAKREAPRSENPQSVLRYQRPLLEGEAITYEFRYEPGTHECHPAVGRLAFLLDPGGVKIHWITDGALEWTGLPPDNSTLEPLNRRGPRPLPLQPGEWNSLALSRESGKLSLRLNGQLIYVRPADDVGDQRFGLYADRNQAGVEVRNVVLTGDWPESLPPDLLEQPDKVAEAGAVNPLNLQPLFGRVELAQNVAGVLRETWTLQPEEKYARLSEWVLPGETHNDFRLTGMFSQTLPSPLARALSPELQRSPDGAELVASALDLIEVARELGRLDELRSRVEQADHTIDALDRRARQALLALIALEQGDKDAAEAALSQLLELTMQSQPATWFEMWPEALVAVRGMERHHDLELVQELVNQLYSARVMTLTPPDSYGCLAHIAVLRGLQRCLDEGRTPEEYYAPPQFRDWVAASRERARSRGDGYPLSRWRISTEWGLEQMAGHQEDFVFYRTPLQGPYEINGEIYGYGTSQFVVGGAFWGARSERNQYETGTFRQGASRPPLEPPTAKMDRWIPVRAANDGSKLEVTVHGRKLHEHQYAAPPVQQSGLQRWWNAAILGRVEESRDSAALDPWLGLRSWWRNTARARDIRVTGSAAGCTEVPLTSSLELNDWLSYFDERVGTPDARWYTVRAAGEQAEIIGAPFHHMTGSFVESLLRYQRPLVEDGRIAYDFWYEPGKFHTHPALDRLVFLLEPSGVRIHWVTDSWYDPTAVSPDNATVEPDCRRGPDELPLRAGAWNQLELQLEGDVARLRLNDTLIYERPLEPENLRTFGLFHFSDQSAVRIRNAFMSGEWPPIPPPVEEQELADHSLLQLDAERDALPSVFQHDFARDGMPEKYFNAMGGYSLGSFQRTAEGVRGTVVSDGGWTSMAFAPRFSLEGDFDLEAGIAGIDLDNCPGQSAMDLLVKLADLKEVRTARAKRENGDHFLKAQLSIGFPDGSRNYQDHILHDDTQSGRLRLARRGETVYMLYAQHDSPRFRLIGEWKASAVESPLEGVRLQINAPKAGHASGTWTHLVLRAERMQYMPLDAGPKPTLYVIDADGGNFREVLAPLPAYAQVGSPEWSHDRKQIALDMSTGSTSSSRIVLINADGTNFRDIGPGCMPSFSPDGAQVAISISGQGVAVMNVDGSGLKIIDPSGWSVQWMPDGKSLVYGKSGNLILHNLATGEGREILQGDAASRYSYIYWNFACAPDGSAVAFRGRLQSGAGDELAVVRLGPSPKLTTLVDKPPSFYPDVGWTPDSRKILGARYDPVTGIPYFQLVPIDGSPPEAMFRVQLDAYRVLGGAWSRDGKQIVFAAQQAPQLVDWPLTESAP